MPSPFAADAGTPNPDVLITQLLIAFGQGAGGLHVHPAVITEAGKEFRALVMKALDNWPTIAIRALEYARALGRVAGHLAVGEGYDIVLLRHTVKAIAMLRRNKDENVCATCPVCFE
jgi:hypothetical protein